jgi:hypothetical protein
MATNSEIKYISRDFNNIRAELINFSQTYFPNTYTDFSPTSPGMMFMEQVAYVSDVMSFYLDNQIQETYLQYARQFDNLYDLAYMFSYKPKTTGLASVDVDIFQQVPAVTSGGEKIPDYSYALLISDNATVSSPSGKNFVIQDSIDFSVSSSNDPTTVSIAQITANEPEYFLLKKTRKAVSGTINSTTFTAGAYQQFPTFQISAVNIGGIIDIFDSNNNQYYEVDYLGQDLIYEGIKNTNVNDPNNYTNSDDTPYILKTKSTNRRFVTRFLNETTLQIQFGAGQPNQVDEFITPNSDNVGIGLPFEQNKLTTAYSPTNFIFTNSYGIAPSNTTLTVRYLTGGGVSSNINAGQLNSIVSSNISFVTSQISDTSLAQYVFDSVAVNNPIAASGGQDGDSIEEIRQNALSNFNTQLRNVTADDYLVRALSMPSKFGNISKAWTQKPKATDPNTTLDMYVLTLDVNGNLTTASTSLKNNLKTYLNQYRMIGDTVDIKDAFIINLACDFEIITLPNFNNNEVLAQCLTALQRFFSIDNYSINQPIVLRDITVLLDNVAGVQTVQNLAITNKAGESSGYSKYAYSIEGATQGGVIYPSLDPSIFEVKYPSNDIKGRVVSLGAGSYIVGGGPSGMGSY